jgi:hypothetical protein
VKTIESPIFKTPAAFAFEVTVFKPVFVIDDETPVLTVKEPRPVLLAESVNVKETGTVPSVSEPVIVYEN